jgi:hypothetical protein
MEDLVAPHQARAQADEEQLTADETAAERDIEAASFEAASFETAKSRLLGR